MATQEDIMPPEPQSSLSNDEFLRQLLNIPADESAAAPSGWMPRIRRPRWLNREQLPARR
jgi:hypothetical protein